MVENFSEKSAQYLSENNELLLYRTFGKSMMPFIKSGETVIVSTDYELKDYDILCYRRPDGKVIVHRAVGVKDGKYLVKGDNTFYDEWIEKSQIIGVAVCRISSGEKIEDLTLKRRKILAKIHNFYPIKRLFNVFYRLHDKFAK